MQIYLPFFEKANIFFENDKKNVKTAKMILKTKLPFLENYKIQLLILFPLLVNE